MSKFYCFKTLSCCHAVWIQIRTYNLGPNYLHGMMYAVIEWGGGLCPSCKIQWGGGLCPSCKIQRGGLCPSCKIHGGDFVHVYKNEQGGVCLGGILSYTRPFLHYVLILHSLSPHMFYLCTALWKHFVVETVNLV